MKIQNEISKTEKLMSSLLVCVKDETLLIEDRNEYYSEYLKSASYLLQLRREMGNPLTLVN